MTSGDIDEDIREQMCDVCINDMDRCETKEYQSEGFPLVYF